ncbi:hypothetical protein BQ8482_80209 [Mesorhizobium delmotii]|uniref:Uncharacterized protein n=1 Tax=Mesorhizobium delmotii TaxID=1631247 RepID=A0A2P9AWP4_9HYPH|nr:hypothetical protein BQ8482_80209 [Mesorhizobium delmotii]
MMSFVAIQNWGGFEALFPGQPHPFRPLHPAPVVNALPRLTCQSGRAYRGPTSPSAAEP